MTFRHYCTYLEHTYLPRLVAMADSLRRHGGGFRLHVLCLSDLCADILAALAIPEIALIRLDDVERRYPELLDVKPTRSQIEYFFTLTPHLPAYCLATDTALDEITYLDSDLCFFADPQAIFGGAKFGRFNVGWITYRRTEQGLRCLADYRRDCIEWCFEALEGDRFADQKYLDRWPDAYAELAIIEHKGVNVATYNVDAYDVTERDVRIRCDDEPLIFYHFHGVYHDTDGHYAVLFPREHGAREATVIRRVYRPYLARLIELRQELRRRFPGFAAAPSITRLLPIDPVKFGELAQWGSDGLVRRCLAHAVDLRASARRGEWPQDPSLRHFMDFADLLAQATSDGRLSVLDWGGGFGEFHWCARALWPELAIAWHVRELSAVCDHGAAVFPETRFLDDDTAAVAPSFDVALASGALQHAADWRAVLGQLAGAARQFLIILDLPVSDGLSVFIQERPLSFLPDAVFASPVLPLPTLTQLLAEHGWTHARDLPPSFAQPTVGGGPQVAYRSMVFRRTT
ncbi:MAG: hypothetical protein HY060_00180 [Proteobacteria bacterium]|nr:hypothetical protein [Pseudomonadota bacterium]